MLELQGGKSYSYESRSHENMLVNWMDTHTDYAPLIFTVKKPKFCREDHKLDEHYAIK